MLTVTGAQSAIILAPVHGNTADSSHELCSKALSIKDQTKPWFAEACVSFLHICMCGSNRSQNDMKTAEARPSEHRSHLVKNPPVPYHGTELFQTITPADSLRHYTLGLAGSTENWVTMT